MECSTPWTRYSGFTIDFVVVVVAVVVANTVAGADLVCRAIAESICGFGL